MHVLFIAAEAMPYARTGGLGETVTSLAVALARAGHRVCIVLPRYRQVHLRRRAVFATHIQVPLGARAIPCTLVREASSPLGPTLPAPVDFYFVECPTYFDRDAIYGTAEQDYGDNAERFTILSRAAIELARRLQPDLIHAHDWHSALAPVLLRTQLRDDAEVGSIPVVFTIHNLGYQGIFPPEVLARLGLSWNLFRVEALEFWGRVNFLKGALVYSDVLTTVSPSYSREIQTPEFGMGLEGVLQARAADLHGILNGIDTERWDPRRDPVLAHPYDAEELEGKQICRAALVREFGIEHPQRPIVAMVSRLTAQKGLELVDACMERLASLEATLIVLGRGEARQEEAVGRWQHRFPQWVRCVLRYDEELAHRLIAGADLLLMPSRYEPCGLSQMHALRYGTVPLVRAVGGLKDTVTEWRAEDATGNGFVFGPFHPDALLHGMVRALENWSRPDAWRQLQRNGMAGDWSWDRAAVEYAALYQGLAPELSYRSSPRGNNLRPTESRRI